MADGVHQLAFDARYSLISNHGSRSQSGEDTLDKAIAAGAHFIQTHQRRDGALIDFLLPPGSSDGWISAHVAWVVEDVAELAAVRDRAAAYLYRTGIERNGLWGFNSAVGPDCDSTAQALLVLGRAGYTLPETWIDDLVSAQHVGGGFPTFASRGPVMNGWRAAHPDVTLVVAIALQRLLAAPAALRRAVGWIDLLEKRHDLCAYWWPSPAYVAWCSVQLGRRSPATSRTIRQGLRSSTGLPDLAMLVWASLRHLNAPDDALPSVAKLVGLQRRDGSWPCSPCLRLTNPDVFAAATNAPGRCYAGRRRLFATAHAVAALSLARQQLTSPVSGDRR